MFLGGFLIVPEQGSKSLPNILRRVAYPVEPFGFKSVQNGPPPPLLGGNRDRLGEQPRLFDQLDDCQANELQCVHRRMQQFSQLSTNRSNLVKIRTGHVFAIRESCFGVKRLEFLLCLNSSWQRGHASAYAKLPSLTPQRGHLLSNIHCLRIFHFCLRFGFSSWRKARAKPPGPALRPSGDVDLDLLGFGFRVLGQVHREHAVFELGANLPWAGTIRKREAAPETTVGAFDAVILSAFLLLLESAFAHDGQRSFLRRDR